MAELISPDSRSPIPWGDGLGLALPELAPMVSQVLGGLHARPMHQAAWDALADRLRPQMPAASWRGENFAITGADGHRLRDAGGRVLGLERSLFRPLGLWSNSVQLNLWRPDGQAWCGRRAFHKAIDPGLWDAVTAGGLGANECAARAVVREAYEECGLVLAVTPRFRGWMRITRSCAQGLQRERVWVFEAAAPEGFAPRAIDGEVMDFAPMGLEDIGRRCVAGEFNPEAAAALIGFPPSADH